MSQRCGMDSGRGPEEGENAVEGGAYGLDYDGYWGCWS